MSKIILGLLAAAALSTAALANDRTEEGTIASRNAYNGAVWASEPVKSDTQGLIVTQRRAVSASGFIVQRRGNASSDFSFDPRTGIRNGNDSK